MFFGYNNSFHFFYKFLKRNTLFFLPLFSVIATPNFGDIFESGPLSKKEIHF